jgi:hypothetical protein
VIKKSGTPKALSEKKQEKTKGEQCQKVRRAKGGNGRNTDPELKVDSVLDKSFCLASSESMMLISICFRRKRNESRKVR